MEHEREQTQAGTSGDAEMADAQAGDAQMANSQIGDVRMGHAQILDDRTGAPTRVIEQVGVLDLTAMDSPDALDGIASIRKVGAILVPRNLVPKLSTIPMSQVGTTIPLPPTTEGVKVRQVTGQTTMSGEALANPDGNPNDVLVVTGQLTITSPVRKVGYGHFIVTGQVLAPQGSEAALGAGLTNLTGQAAYFPYTEGAAVKVQVGSTRMSGQALANPAGQETDILVVIGSLIVTSPMERVGYQHIAVVGTVLAPPESEAALSGRVTSIGSGVVYYTAPPRVFDGKDAFPSTFFEYLDEPITLVLSGSFAIEDDVTPELLKQKVAGIVLSGKLTAPRQLVGVIQALTLAKSGTIAISADAGT